MREGDTVGAVSESPMAKTADSTMIPRHEALTGFVVPICLLR